MYQSMISSWRDKKGMGDYAFMTVQLPPSVASTEDPTKALNTGRMQIRLAEAEASPHTGGLTDISGVSVSLDCGGKSAWGWDHPPNKNEISRRLALQTVHAAFAVQGRIPRAVAGADKESMTSSMWTGPVFAAASSSGGEVTLTFEDFSAVGLKLKDVLSTNPDGSTNNCSARTVGPSCCEGMPPFELGNGEHWVRPKTAEIKLMGNRVVIAGTPGMTQVRYGWADFVDCVLVNNDSLPAGPFVANVSTPMAAAVNVPAVASADVAAAMIQSPPMGTNTWNFYHCNIDENIVKQLAASFKKNGMAKVGYEYINIDDCWQVERLPNGTIVPDPARFPSGMRALSDYVHSQGLKFGLVSTHSLLLIC